MLYCSRVQSIEDKIHYTVTDKMEYKGIHCIIIVLYIGTFIQCGDAIEKQVHRKCCRTFSYSMSGFLKL